MKTGRPSTAGAHRPQPWIARLHLTAAAATLVVAVFVVFWPALSNGFVDYDDDLYVTANDMVKHGLTVETVRWAFTTTYAYNWHPVTWLSHLADVQWHGMDPRGHHLTSVAAHALNAVLLLLVARALTGSLRASLIAAAVFALHPLRVESVAWVAERKDLLSACGFLAGILCYNAYVRTRRLCWYGAMVVAHAFGLLSKSMVVTFPFVLLLLDVWPLGRWRPAAGMAAPRRLWRSGARLLLEKAPLLLLSVVVAVVTSSIQWEDYQEMTQRISPRSRFGNAFVSLFLYWGKTAWPLRLAHFYPHPGESLTLMAICAAAGGLIAAVVLALLLSNRVPWLGFGWYWYLVTILPVIGIVQVGAAGMADRYTYLPFMGPAIALGVAVSSVRGGGRRVRPALTLAIAILVVAAALLAHRQVGVWRSSWTLATHAVEVTERNWLALNDVGTLLGRQQRWREAVGYLRESVRYLPNWHLSRFNLGRALMATGDYAGAAEQFGAAVRIKPHFFQAHQAEAAARFRLAGSAQGGK